MTDSVNFDVFQGDNFVLNVYYKDSNGVPIDLTGYNVTCAVRDSFGGKTLCAQVLLGLGIDVTPEEGLISINFDQDQTKNFTVPKAVWQLQIEEPVNSIKKTIAHGVLRVEKAAVQ